jgi:hypothetical protein
VALQGTIDAFPLTDVLQLLSTSSKSGRLLLEGDRGRVELWIDQGAVVGGDAEGMVTGAAQLVFELLRFDDGSFVFDVAEGMPAVAVEVTPLAACVDDAAAMLETWRGIEAVVPSLQHRVALRTELDEPSVTVSAQEWTVLAAVADGPSVGAAGQRLGLDDFACCAALAELVGRSLLVVDEPALDAEPFDGPIAAARATPELAAEPPVVADAADLGSLDPESDPSSDDLQDEAFPDRFPIDDLLGNGSDHDGTWADDGVEAQRFAAAQTFEPLGADTFPHEAAAHDPFGTESFGTESFGTEAFGTIRADAADVSERTAEAWDEVVSGQVPAVDDPWGSAPADDAAVAAAEDTADEVLRQMSRLSPKAAEAIAAALNGPAAPSPVPAGAADGADRRDNDGPVSFLGSF